MIGQVGRIDPRTLPARPPSEVEWEELLVRLEIAPRALRIAVDEAPGGHPAVRDALMAGLAAELLAQSAIEAMAAGGAPESGLGVDAAGSDAELLSRLAALRARTFAMVQRRGLNVWEWTTPGGVWPGATAYQVLLAAIHLDAALLDAVRRAGRREAGG
ncbi:MAG TPA: hypothetical protein VFR37_24690 [Longimicrobium sp.]|nr:hypothetical protein [Longimicrobium sp.]